MTDLIKVLKKAVTKRVSDETSIKISSIASKEEPVCYFDETSINFDERQPEGSLSLVFIQSFENQTEMDAIDDKVSEIILSLNREEDALKAIQQRLTIVVFRIDTINQYVLPDLEAGNKSYSVYEFSFAFIGDMIRSPHFESEE